jgi:hypothetical protein
MSAIDASEQIEIMTRECARPRPQQGLVGIVGFLVSRVALPGTGTLRSWKLEYLCLG